MKEKRIPGYDGYSVNSLGRVFSLSSNWRGRGKREMVQSRNNDGYFIVRLTNKEGQRKKVPVHRIVCLSFHGMPPSERHEVRHLDGNKENNNHENLCWGTRAENAQDRINHGKLSGIFSNAQKLTHAQVLQIRKIYRPGMGGVLSRHFSVSYSTITAIARGETWEK